MKGPFLAVFLVAGAAYAAVPGTTVVSYSIGNETGATQTDLHVDANQTVDTATTSSFGLADVNGSSVQFSDGNIGAGSNAAFTLSSTTGELGDFTYVLDYCWQSSTCLPGTETDPLYLDVGVDGTSGGADLELSTGNTSGVNYTNLSVTQDGNSIVTAATSGTVNGDPPTVITGDLNFANGPIDFSVYDSTDHVTINGSFTPTPEPSTLGMCALILLGTVIAVRRRQLRNQ